MNTLLRIGLAPALAVIVLTSVVHWSAGRLHGLDLLSALQELACAEAASQELEAADRPIVQCIEEKYRLAHEVAAGRMELREAAVLYQKLNEVMPAMPWDAWRTFHPGRTDAERHGREVLGFVRVVLDKQPECAPVLARLEAELDRLGEVPATGGKLGKVAPSFAL